MKKYLLIPVLILLALTQANSQVRCGFDGVLNAELEKDPKYSINIEEVNAKIERQIMRQKTFNSVDDIVYIPVVFHILHRGGAVGAYDNPTDASVISTVDYLNQVYDGTWNGTGGSILGVGDVNIKFVLATKDPDNNTTTGIERIDASSIGDYSSSGLKLRGTSGVDEATLKNLSRWDPFKYYNIWVVHEIDGCGGSPNNCSSWTGGFAYFPFEPVGVSTLELAGRRDRDGTVMLATGMSPGNALLPHEIGHALNLYHPFQGTDNTGACPPADPTEGDRCADTDPITNPQGAWNTYSGYARDGSPYPLSNPNSCADGKPYNELTEKNFMNYTFTTRLFTADQKNRMKASVMSTIREGLSTSWANNKGAYPTTWVAPKAAVVTPVTSETGMGGGGIYAGIYRVELNDMIVNSLVTNQEGGYLNNADKWYNLFSIKAGSTYTMKVNIFNGNNNQLGVYIDYDNDGAFNETTEKIFLDTNIPTSDGTGYTSEKSITFTVPASASMSTGSIVRMRVINDLSSIYGLAPVSGSSSSLSYGQAEDYAIYLGADNAVTLSSAAGTDSQTACINMAIINITYATTGATGATFSGLPTGVSGNWSANVVTISGTPSVVGASQPYTITLTGGSGAVTTTGTLTVVSTISPSFTQVGPVCSGASLSALPTTSTNGITGTWSPVINNTATTNYTFTPSEEGQCTTTASMTITVNTLPTAAITNNTATTVLTCSTAAISVTATGGVSYAWNNSLGTNATANITAAGTYTVTVTNANGCTDTQSITITENLSYTEIYVNKTATGNNNGTSWTDAYTDLQDAIDNQCGGFDIWVAAGTYYPTKDHTGNTSPTDNRDKNFHLGTDMKIYGGFAGTETQLSARDAAANITILSGDFNNDDTVTGGGSTLSITGNTENAYHVMLTADLTNAAVIDGFTIKGGNAGGGSSTITYQSKSFSTSDGGGMYNESSSPTITNSTFTKNNASDVGGGMFNSSSSSPTITNSTFTNNSAGDGGGMANNSSSPTITNSTFADNNAEYAGGMDNYSSSPTITNSTFANNYANLGGGMDNYSSSPTITNSTFANNYAEYGGGMANNSSSPTITNSTFTNNSAGDGGGMANNSSSPTITNSTFANNNAGYYGGGMSNYYLSSPTITNSTFTNNNSDYGGGGMYNTDSSSPTITNSTFANNYADLGGGMANDFESSPTITNSIIWSNGSTEVVINDRSTPTFKSSIIKSSNGSGGSWNTAYGTDNGDNLDTDPLFVNAANGDYRVQSCSPAIDAGDNAAWTTTTLSTDIAGNTRPFNSTVDIGAYEYQGIPIAISIAAPTVTQPTCAVPSGTIVVNATTTSGTLEYSIDNGSTYQASATFSGLSGGSYTIKAREQGSSCTETYGSNPVVINTPVILTIAAPTVTQPTCAVPSGTIVVNATTTSGTLEYSVDNGSTYQTESTFSGLSAGSYTITVREQGSSCTETYGSNPVVINTPVILTIAAPTVTQPTCAVPSGTIVVNATTTSGTLEYSVDNGSTYQASNTFGGLSGGSYTIKIRVEGSVCEGTYGSNPVAIDTLLLTYELTPSISVSQTELCVGESITLSATNIPNSVDGATIHWTGGFTGESITVSPSTSGDFRVAVRSANGCLSDSSDAVSITVNQLPSNPVITSDNASLCTGETVTLSGSCETNTVFSWITPVENTNGATTSALSNSNQRVINAAGTYTGYCETTTGCRSGEVSIVITESTNCGSEQVIAISPAKPTICPGEVISLTASGCTGTLTWSGGLASQIGSTASFNPVIATTYSVTCSTGGSGTVDVSVVKANEVISSNISTGTSQVRALETIQSDKKIGDTNVTPAPNVIFQSGKSILLSPGFEVTTESVFKAIIQITCPEQ
jgi:hypothetical protein